jgi:hypothetical protein
MQKLATTKAKIVVQTPIVVADESRVWTIVSVGADVGAGVLGTTGDGVAGVTT